MKMTYHKKPNNLTLKDEFIMKNEFVFFCYFFLVKNHMIKSWLI